jgi:hypothetical protein
VYARHLTASSRGQGIEVLYLDTISSSSAPLYTKGFIKTHEFRVHVANGRGIDVSKKRRRSGSEAHPLIKNSDNGWVFCRDGVSAPSVVVDIAVKAVMALGLEINTAIGMEGTTVDKYVQVFRGLL